MSQSEYGCIRISDYVPLQHTAAGQANVVLISSVGMYFLDCQNLTTYCIALKVIFKRLVYNNVYSQLCGHIPTNND